jgi:hypothetical protein
MTGAAVMATAVPPTAKPIPPTVAATPAPAAAPPAAYAAASTLSSLDLDIYHFSKRIRDCKYFLL